MGCRQPAKDYVARRTAAYLVGCCRGAYLVFWGSDQYWVVRDATLTGQRPGQIWERSQ